MDEAQIARMIEWLDEERRRDKAKIAKLEEYISQQQDLIEGMTRRMNGLEGEQSTMRGQFVPSSRDAEIMEQLRGEIQQALETVEVKRVTAEREADRRAEISRDGIVRPLRDLGDRIDKLERALEEVGASRVERDRFAAALASLQQRSEDLAKKFEDPERRLIFLEEQRRQDARRISETQSEMPEMQKQIDAVKPKLDLLEALALRNEKLILDTQNSERDRRDQIQSFIDQQTLFVQQRDQRIDELTRTFGQFDEAMRRNMDRFESWSEVYRQMKKIVDDFDRIGERLERRINEVAEMQRLSEERFRQEWGSWSADDQKRWKQFTLTNDEAWHSHDREFEQFRTKVNEAIALFGPVQDNIERLWKLNRAQADLFRDRYQALVTEHDQPSEKSRLLSTSNTSISSSNGNGRS